MPMSPLFLQEKAEASRISNIMHAAETNGNNGGGTRVQGGDVVHSGYEMY